MDWIVRHNDRSGEVEEITCADEGDALEAARALIANSAAQPANIRVYREVPLTFQTIVKVRKRSSSAGPQEAPTPSDPSAVPAGEKSRDVPEHCILEGCSEKGSARNQWHCVKHAGEVNVQERRMRLEAWKKLRAVSHV